MKIEQRIDEQFTLEKLVQTLAHYQLYYQIAMAVFMNETSSDEKEVSQKIQDSEWDIEPLHVLNTMKTIIENFYEEDDFNVIFEDNLKVNAFLHALKDFTHEVQTIKSKEEMYAHYHEKILNDEFYNVKMHLHFENEFQERLDYWNQVISSQAASELKTSAYKLLVGFTP